MTQSACVGHKKYPGTIRRRCPGRSSSGRIALLFGCCILAWTAVAAAGGTSAGRHRTTPPASKHHWWPLSGSRGASDVQVFFSDDGTDGIRSQSISAADPTGGSERFPRQLDTVHDHLIRRKTSGQRPRAGAPRTPPDSEYARFINERFRQDQHRQYQPESESEQMARDHERFRELPHYHRRQFPVAPAHHLQGHFKVPRTPFQNQMPRRRPQQQRRPGVMAPSVQGDVEDYQANDETLAVRRRLGDTDDYQRIKQLSEEQQQTHPEHCKAVFAEKDGMVCRQCRNPSTGAKSESCSYAQKPHSKKYAYSNSFSKKRPSSSGEEEEDDSSEEEEDDEEEDGDEDEDRDSREEDEEEPEIHTSRPPLRKRNQSRTDRRPRIKRESHAKTKNGGGGRWRRRRRKGGNAKGGAVSQRMELFQGDKHSSAVRPEFHEFLPDTVNGSRTEGGGDVVGAGATQDYELVARALADFRKLDWDGDCKKSERNGLTCYVCGDKQDGGVVREQCMFVSESASSSAVDEPSTIAGHSSHLTYAVAEGESYNWDDNGPPERTTGAAEGGGEKAARDEDVGSGTAAASIEPVVVAIRDEAEERQQQPQSENTAEFMKALGHVQWMDRNNNHLTDQGGDAGSTFIGHPQHGSSPLLLGGWGKKNNVKLNRKIVIKKRKLKQQQSDYADADDGALNPGTDTSAAAVAVGSAVTEKPPLPVKRTIRKKVTYRKTVKDVVRKHTMKDGSGAVVADGGNAGPQ